MKIRVVREIFSDTYTHGRLYVDGVFQCYTLEDKDRFLELPQNEKVPGESAIPIGEYKLIIDLSRRFGRIMPHVLDVPRFEGVRIHSGNTSQDTEGCLLVGNVRNRDRVTDSRAAFTSLMDKLEDAYERGQSINIVYERADV